MRIRRTAAAALAALLTFTAACEGGAAESGRSSDGSPPTGPTASGTGSNPSPGVPAPANSSATNPALTNLRGGTPTDLVGSPIDPAQFVASVEPELPGVSSITGTVAVSSPTVQEDGTYRATYRDGTVTGIAADMTITSRGKVLTMSVVAVQDMLYVRSAGLTSELHVTKPWLLISKDSSDPEIAEIGATLTGILDGIGPARYRQLSGAFVAVSDLGQDPVNGAAAHHYRALADPAASTAGRGATSSSTPPGGVNPVAVDIWVDGQERVVSTTKRQTVAGQQVVSTDEVTSFDEPVTITAPDPAEVATS